MMKSPLGQHLPMQQVTLEEGLIAFRCPESSGHYITLQAYWSWLKKQPERLEHLPQPPDIAPDASEPKSAKICPETGTIMIHYKVGHGFSFSIDRSITGGVWFDAGEWEALRSRNFHDEIHLIFTAPWQNAVMMAAAQEVHRNMLSERLGETLLEELQTLREQLKSHPHRDLALAYLNNVK
ncbi:hypothetical protein HW115_15145 [Verrucomicrobiaceae bacterium N1E253]|uniref:Uncharacterized protein n=1 Tax=Oceaniferula marina TaxID=2748318 RepID=A0A851GPL3_9BACT|nr:hypothetical protein [Oceaniferula marina]NWK56957.1 hypothetical protein [Oceaniferula marina]